METYNHTSIKNVSKKVNKTKLKNIIYMKHTFFLSFSVFKIKQCGHNAPEVLCYGYISPVFS